MTTIDDVVTAIETIERDPAGPNRAGRAVVVECIAAEKVIASLMKRAGL